MKVHVTSDKVLRDYVRQQLRANGGYCPCVVDSKGKEEYRCMCRDFIINTQVGESCHCGLYIKDE